MNRRELEERTAEFARAAYRLCQGVRIRPGGAKPADQLQDSSSSMAANYRAAGRSRSPREFVAKIGTVNEESDESVYWLEYIRDNTLAAVTDVMPLYDEARELRAIFGASYATAKRNAEKREQERLKRKGDNRRRRDGEGT
jgi:four helix bundle protein